MLTKAASGLGPCTGVERERGRSEEGGVGEKGRGKDTE